MMKQRPSSSMRLRSRSSSGELLRHGELQVEVVGAGPQSGVGHGVDVGQRARADGDQVDPGEGGVERNGIGGVGGASARPSLAELRVERRRRRLSLGEATSGEDHIGLRLAQQQASEHPPGHPVATQDEHALAHGHLLETRDIGADSTAAL